MSVASTKIKKLSDKEKVQYFELQRTREKILNELGRLSTTENVNDLTHITMGTTQLNASAKRKKMGRSASSSGIDMIPVGGSGSGQKGKSIKLPLFKLPAIEPKHHFRLTTQQQQKEEDCLRKTLLATTTARSAVNATIDKASTSATLTATNNAGRPRRFLSYTNISTFRKVLLHMIKGFTEQDRKFLNNYFQMRESEIEDIRKDIISKIDMVALKGEDAYKKEKPGSRQASRQGSRQGNRNDVASDTQGFQVHSIMLSMSKESSSSRTVFIKAKNRQVVLQDSERRRMGLGVADPQSKDNPEDAKQLAKIKSMQSLLGPTSAASLDNMQFGGSSGMRSLTPTGGSQQKLLPIGNQSNMSMSMGSIKNRSVMSLSSQKSKKGGKTAGYGGSKRISVMGGSKVPASDALTMELMASLRNMERCNISIKKDIASVQEIVNVNDDKARNLLFTVGAERMHASLRGLIRIDIARGFSAWCTVVQNIRQQEKLSRFFQFLVIRNVSVGLDQLAKKVCRSDFEIWKKFTVEETKRIQRVKMQKAAKKIQAFIRGVLTRTKVKIMKQRRKYQKLYDSILKIQAVMRGSLCRMSFHKASQLKAKNKAASFIQNAYRGYRARKKIIQIKLRQRKVTAATILQKYIRGSLARKKVKTILAHREHVKSAVKVQKVIRGFNGRRRVSTMIINRARYKYARRIQARVRGMVIRIHKMKRIKEMHAAREFREKSARMIQTMYRGYQGRVLVRMMIFQMRKKRAKEYAAATVINSRIRIVVCKAQLRELKKDRYERWIQDAKIWQESWEEDSQQWYFIHNETGESQWEPAKTGYTKADGRLVLSSGQIINDPTVQGGKKIRYDTFGDPIDEEDEGEEEEEQPAMTKAQLSKMCSECTVRVAIRNCNECGDKFCTKCYKDTHKLGSRRKHIYTPCGPIDCSECEICLADRYCHSCDESFCDEHWRKVHSKGKRLYHAYSDVSEAGVIDSRVFTMDGQEAESYSATSVQESMDMANASLAMSQSQTDEGYYAIENGGVEEIYTEEIAEEWSQYYDDDGYEYWYNNNTGQSSYENPY